MVIHREQLVEFLEFTAVGQKRILVPKDNTSKNEPLHKTNPEKFGAYQQAKNKSRFGGPETTINNAKILAKLRTNVQSEG